jgi:hypothetical protein
VQISVGRTRRLWLAILATAATIGALSWFNSGIEGWRFVDFKKAYYAAGETVLQNGSASLWPLIEDANFVNLPIVAWIFAPLGWLGPREGSLAFLLLGLAATAGALLLIANFDHARMRPLVALLFAVNGPLWYSFLIGNTTHFILLLLASALLLWNRNWRFSTGILIGIAVIIKPILFALGGYFLLKRNWRIVFGGATVIGLALLSSVTVFGLQFNLDWYERIIVAFAGRPMGAFNVQSLDAFLLRLQTGTQLLFDWHPQTLPFGLSIVRNALIAALLIAVLLAMWRNRKTGGSPTKEAPQGRDFLEFCLILTICVTISTVSWTHYYLLLLLPWSLYLAGELPLVDDTLTHRFMWGSMILCAMPSTYPGTAFGWLAFLSSRTLQSVWLLGGLLLLWALLRSALRCQRENINPWLPALFHETDRASSKACIDAPN